MKELNVTAFHLLSLIFYQNEIIELVAASKKIMPHFHIPLQSGSNKILASMRRRYKKELYAEKVALIKKLIPDCCIGVDVITGFPGETMMILMKQ